MLSPRARTRVALLALTAPLVGGATTPKKASPGVLEAMQAELQHSLAALKTQAAPPYFLSYEITETHSVQVTSSFGALEWSGESKNRALDVDLRVGGPELDNTHPIRQGRASVSDRLTGSALIPLEDSPDAIRAVLWYQTDKKYKQAVEQLTKVKTNVTVKVDEEDKSADFSPEPKEAYSEPQRPFTVDRKAWEEKIRRYTSPFAKHGDIYVASAAFSAEIQTKW